MLDNLENIKKIDKTGMLDAIEKLPEQIKESEEIVENANLNSLFKVDHIIINGMGASGISGDILQSLFRDKLDIPVFAHFDHVGSHYKMVDLFWIANLVAYAAKTGKTSFSG